MRIRVAYMALMACAALVTTAEAKPEYADMLTDVYKPYAAALSARSCANCHVSESDFALNPYGKQIAHELLTANQKALTSAILQKIESLDADGDGTANIDEIKAGTEPGNAKSGGTGKAPTAESSASAGTTEAEPKKPWPPKNAYHPAVVHFPIALFIAGLLLDLLGALRNNKTLLFAGWYNLVLAAISSFGAIATGLVAMMLLRLPFRGLIFQHLLLAILSTVLMWIMVGLRVHRHERMTQPLRIVYYVLAVAGFFLISYSGHLGGVFVYGE